MFYDLTSAPATEPVTLPEAKTHLKAEDFTDDDAYISSLITAARKHVEKITSYVCITSTWCAYAETWPASSRAYLIKFPVTAISKVEYIPAGGSAYVEMDASLYDASGKSNPPAVKFFSLPSLADRITAIKITFTAGHANTVSDPVPADLVQAIKILMLSMYQNRQEEVSGTIISKLSYGFEYLCDKIRMLTV